MGAIEPSPQASLHEVPAGFRNALPRVIQASPFLRTQLHGHPQWLMPQILQGALSASGLLADWEAAIVGASDESELRRRVRQLRRQGMVFIAWRDLAGLAPLDETLHDLSALADVLVDATLTWLQHRHAQRFGEPRGPDGAVCRLVVFGLGKLGGNELNMSSDVDLVFAFEHEGEMAHGTTHGEYFARLARELVQVLSDRTEDGFVYRVDTLLRPFGKAGALAVSAAALEEYCQVHGREWERYAWIKARPVAGDRAAGERILRSLQPFIYRRYLDYGVFESLRDMKRRIAEDAARRGKEEDLKLGAGGIREIEFIAQAFQLVRGGQVPALRQRSLRATLAAVAELGLMPAADVAALDAAYVFLRRAENRIQIYEDHQTHVLPAGEPAQLALAQAMGYAGWADFYTALQKVRAEVEALFARTFASPAAASAEFPDTRDLSALWQEDLSGVSATDLLGRLGFRSPAETLELLGDLRQRLTLRSGGETGRRRLAQLMPLLIHAAGGSTEPDAVMRRLADILIAIAGRTAYIALLLENPPAISQLVRLCAASAWIAERLARHPASLDLLLDPRLLYSPPRKAALREELAQQIGHVPAEDVEQQMDVMRRFKHAQVLRVAAADISEAIPLMVVSDHLTEIAEVLLEHAVTIAHAHLVAKHGVPQADGREVGLCIVAYGKLGGIELGYGSDLDLVFLHDGQEQALTNGPKPIEHGVFFTRMAQRIVHLLSTPTAAGAAYEIDLALRPSGASGLLVSSLPAFEDYQREQAWTWEHQALVRARPVAGSPALGEAFNALRRAVLCRPRDASVLRDEVAEMRAKMRRHRDRSSAGQFDLKQGLGGITDIEFMVQYCVLREAVGDAELVRYSDNIRMMERLGQSAAPQAAQVAGLAETYRRLRRRVHQLDLQQLASVVPDREFSKERAAVVAIWEQLLGAEGAPQ